LLYSRFFTQKLTYSPILIVTEPQSPAEMPSLPVAGRGRDRYRLIETMKAEYEKGIRDTVPVTVLLLLCFLWSLGSIRSDLMPGVFAADLPPFEREALHLGVLAAVGWLLAAVLGAKWPKGRQIWDAVLIGLGLFVVPALLGEASKGEIPDLTRVALYSLTPVFAVAFEPYLGRLTESQAKGGLLAALGCVIGTLGVFPLVIPRTWQGVAGFFAIVLAVACVAATNCLAVRTISEMPLKSGSPVAAIAGATSAAILAAASLVSEHPTWGHPVVGLEIAWTTAVELPELLLLFWLMRRMSAVRMTTRFVVTPLIVNVVGFIVLRPSMRVRAGLGILLLALSTGWLLSAREEEGEATGLPLNLNQN
jgi:drug/metabolite transporter (DMT)-like permease